MAVRAADTAGRTVIEVAGLDRRMGGDLQAEVDALAAALHDVHEQKETV